MRIYPWVILVLMTAIFAGGCKRKDTKVPTIQRAPLMEGPTSQAIAAEKQDKLLDSLAPIPELGHGTIAKTPDGEVWTLYSNGLMIHDLKPNDELVPKWGQTVTISYILTFPGQDKPVEKRTADNPLSFPLGSTDLIKGMNMGVSTMHLGMRRRIFVPPDLGYGPGGSPRAEHSARTRRSFLKWSFSGSPARALTCPKWMPRSSGRASARRSARPRRSPRPPDTSSCDIAGMTPSLLLRHRPAASPRPRPAARPAATIATTSSVPSPPAATANCGPHASALPSPQ